MWPRPRCYHRDGWDVAAAAEVLPGFDGRAAGCDLGQDPAGLFGPVAHVLAFLYRPKRKGSAADTHRMNAPLA
jgi:hypothetical protein